MAEKDEFLDAAAAAAGLLDPPESTTTAPTLTTTTAIGTTAIPAPSTTTKTTYTLPSFPSLGGVKFKMPPVSTPQAPRGGFPIPSYAGDSFKKYRDPILGDDLSEISLDMHKSEHRPRSAPLPPGLPQLNQSTHMDSLQRKIKLLELQLQDTVSLYRLCQMDEDPSEMRESIAHKSQALESEKTRLKLMREIQAQNGHRFPIPPDPGGTTPLKSLLDLAPKTNDLFTILTRVSLTATAQRLSHADIKIILVNVLQGDHLRAFKSMSDLPVPEIVDSLAKRFLRSESVATFNRKLALFQKEPSETLEQALERARILVRQSNCAYLPEDRKGREKSILHSVLMRSVSERTANYLANCEEKALNEGRVLTNDELVDIADSIETITTPVKPTGTVEFSVDNIEQVNDEDAEINAVSPGILRPAKLQAPRSSTSQSPGPDRTRMDRSLSRDNREERRRDFRSRSRDRRDNLLRERRSSSSYAPRQSRETPMDTSSTGESRGSYVRRGQSFPPSPFSPPPYNESFRRPPSFTNRPPTRQPLAREQQYPQEQRVRYAYESPPVPYPPYAGYFPRDQPRSFRDNRWDRQYAMPPQYDPYFRGPPFLETEGPIVQRLWCSRPFITQSFRGNGLQRTSYRDNSRRAPNWSRNRPMDRSQRQPQGRTDGFPRQERPRQGNYTRASAQPFRGPRFQRY